MTRPSDVTVRECINMLPAGSNIHVPAHRIKPSPVVDNKTLGLLTLADQELANLTAIMERVNTAN